MPVHDIKPKICIQMDTVLLSSIIVQDDEPLMTEKASGVCICFEGYCQGLESDRGLVVR